MRRYPTPSRPAWLQILVATAGLLFFFAVYFAFMRILVDISRLDETTTANRRDLIYFEVHTGLLVSAALVVPSSTRVETSARAARRETSLAIHTARSVPWIAITGAVAIACATHIARSISSSFGHTSETRPIWWARSAVIGWLRCWRC